MRILKLHCLVPYNDSIQCFVITGRWVSQFLRWPKTMGPSMLWCLCTRVEFCLGKTADMCGSWPVSPLRWSFFSLEPPLTVRYCSQLLLPTRLQQSLSLLYPYKFRILEFLPIFRKNQVSNIAAVYCCPN